MARNGNGTDGRFGRRPPANSKLQREPCAPGDEVVGEYSRDRLLRMDEKFCAAMERAIARGLERRADGEAPERAA